jgi:hypothetical protein
MTRFLIGWLFLGCEFANVANGAMKDLRISELTPVSATNRATRWMALYNSGNEPLSLNSIGLFISFAVQSGNTFYARPSTNYTIAPFAFAVIGNNAMILLGDRNQNQVSLSCDAMPAADFFQQGHGRILGEAMRENSAVCKISLDLSTFAGTSDDDGNPNDDLHPCCNTFARVQLWLA